MKNDLPPKSLDVLFLLEGTYPYVRGGVSSWVNRLLLGLLVGISTRTPRTSTSLTPPPYLSQGEGRTGRLSAGGHP